MLFNALISVFTFIIDLIFSIVPPLPELDSSLIDSIYNYLDLIIGNGIRLIGLFIRPSTILALVPLAILINNFEYVFKLVMFILRKIPIFNIK